MIYVCIVAILNISKKMYVNVINILGGDPGRKKELSER